MTSGLLNELVADIDAALLQFGLGWDTKDAALTIRAHLIDLLALLDRNPGLDAVADDVQKSVHAVVETTVRRGADDRQMKLLSEAHTRFGDRLKAACVEHISEDGLNVSRIAFRPAASWTR